MSTTEGVSGLEVIGAHQDRQEEILTPQALELIARLHRELNPRRTSATTTPGKWPNRHPDWSTGGSR
jgi:malate synthase